jgi:hypothetical protein
MSWFALVKLLMAAVSVISKPTRAAETPVSRSFATTKSSSCSSPSLATQSFVRIFSERTCASCRSSSSPAM